MDLPSGKATGGELAEVLGAELRRLGTGAAVGIGLVLAVLPGQITLGTDGRGVSFSTATLGLLLVAIHAPGAVLRPIAASKARAALSAQNAASGPGEGA